MWAVDGPRESSRTPDATTSQPGGGQGRHRADPDSRRDGRNHVDETAAPQAGSDRRRRPGSWSRVVCGGRAPRGRGRHAEAEKWVEALPVPPVLDGRGGGKSFKIAARESTTWKFHPDLPATRTWGYWSDRPAGGPAVPGADDRGDPAAQRQRGDVGDDRVAQRARQRVPAQRSDDHGGRDARAAGPDRHAPARRRESSAVRRYAAAVVHEGRREGPALHHQHVHLLQRAARQHGLVSRPRARQHPHERLRGARRALLHPRRPGHG